MNCKRCDSETTSVYKEVLSTKYKVVFCGRCMAWTIDGEFFILNPPNHGGEEGWQIIRNALDAAYEKHGENE